MGYYDAPERKSGELDAIVWEVDYGESVDLALATHTFDCWREIGGERVSKFSALATIANVTPENAAEKSVWRLRFQPTEEQVAVEYDEAMVGEFVQDFGPGVGKKFQPPGQDFIRFLVYSHGSQVSV